MLLGFQFTMKFCCGFFLSHLFVVDPEGNKGGCSGKDQNKTKLFSMQSQGILQDSERVSIFRRAHVALGQKRAQKRRTTVFGSSFFRTYQKVFLASRRLAKSYRYHAVRYILGPCYF